MAHLVTVAAQVFRVRLDLGALLAQALIDLLELLGVELDGDLELLDHRPDVVACPQRERLGGGLEDRADLGQRQLGDLEDARHGLGERAPPLRDLEDDVKVERMADELLVNLERDLRDTEARAPTEVVRQGGCSCNQASTEARERVLEARRRACKRASGTGTRAAIPGRPRHAARSRSEKSRS